MEADKPRTHPENADQLKKRISKWGPVAVGPVLATTLDKPVFGNPAHIQIERTVFPSNAAVDPAFECALSFVKIGRWRMLPCIEPKAAC